MHVDLGIYCNEDDFIPELPNNILITGVKARGLASRKTRFNQPFSKKCPVQENGSCYLIVRVSVCCIVVLRFGALHCVCCFVVFLL